MLQIQPAEVSEEWAGIFLLHELVHLFDRKNGIEPLHPDKQQYLAGEARAYEVELLAMNYASKEQYSKVMGEELARLGITSPEDIYEIYKSKQLEKLGATFMKLDQTIGSGKPKSEKEAGNRMGFHVMAMGRYLGGPKAFMAYIEKITTLGGFEDAIPDIQKSGEAPKVEAAELKQRLLEKQAWLKTLEELVRKTKNPEAKLVLEFVRDNGIVGLPRVMEGGQMGIQVLEKPKGDFASWFNFVPLVKEDEALGGAWEGYTATNIPASGLDALAVAHFLPGLRAIIVKGNTPMSDIWRGIMFAHEGFHAKTYLAAPYDLENRHTFCEKERDAHNFQNELMVKLGGATYQTALEDEMQRMNTVLTAGGLEVGEAHVGRAEYDARLEQAFGPSLSDYEKAARGTQFWMHANFQMIERSFLDPIKAEEEKAEVYCSIVPRSSK